ncbi:MAG: putative 2OG-Fe(II) oxygenase, partial [Sphingopyxis sp.]
HIGTAAARSFWPYLSLAWRVMGDARATWLDGADGYVRTHDLGMNAPELAELATLLAGLMQHQAPFHDQSVRGGVQTDRHLFLNPHPIIQRVRARVDDAVAAYIAALPPPIAGHPLLDPAYRPAPPPAPPSALASAPANAPASTPPNAPRGPLYDGSWAVRLSQQGFHANHTHHRGWISSAAHIVLPPPAQMGAQPAGWLSFGQGPPELGLGLPAITQVRPQAGRLVLFPATLWHGTIAFAGGERLTMAFDVRPPHG